MKCDDSFVIIASLKASDRSEGQHAIAIWNGGIYDANSRRVLKKKQEALDWCCGGGEVTCTGIHRSYQLLPINHRNVKQEARFVFQTKNSSGKLVRGWIVSQRPVMTLIQFTTGEKREATPYEMSNLTRLE